MGRGMAPRREIWSAQPKEPHLGELWEIQKDLKKDWRSKAIYLESSMEHEMVWQTVKL